MNVTMTFLPGEVAQRILAVLDGQMDAVSSEEWEPLLSRVWNEGVPTLVFDAIRRKRSIGSIPVTSLATLTGYVAAVKQANERIFATLQEVASVLRGAGIEIVVLKGAALAELVYENRDLRPMVDLDLLVKPELAERAIEVLLAAGFVRAGNPMLRPGFEREFRVEAELLSPGVPAVSVEIHWHLTGPLFVCRRVDYEQLWQRVTPVTIASSPVLVLGPEDWVLQQVAHACYKHRRVRLLDLWDLDHLVRFLGDRVDWDRLVELGGYRGWLTAVAAMAGPAVELLGTPIPETVLQRARTYRAPWPDRWYAEWWTRPGRAEELHVIPDWLALGGVGARWRVLRAYLTPSREYKAAIDSKGGGEGSPLRQARQLWHERRSSMTNSRTARREG